MIKIFLRRLLLICVLVHSHICTIAQDTSRLRISLLTCTPGDELYSTFGHSALRITDSSKAFNEERDIVFNYGTFNFDEPGFYTKFIRGKLLYFVSTASFSDFKDEYQYFNRGITEQLLNLTGEEKIAVQKFLYWNIREENKYYKYDFLFDNCTTRLRDVIVQNKKDKPVFRAVMPAGTRFRQAIHQYLDKNDMPWSKLGIDLLLGAPTDAVMTAEQSQFLPDNLLKAFDSSDNRLVLTKAGLYPYNGLHSGKSFFSPMVVFLLLLFIIIALGFSGNKYAVRFLQGFDRLLFFAIGTAGILFVFMWLGTDHAMCKNNFNLLWAWPTHAVAAFFINSKKSWIKKYLTVTAFGMLLLLACWFFLPQQLNSSLTIIIVLIIVRTIRKINGAFL